MTQRDAETQRSERGANAGRKSVLSGSPGWVKALVVVSVLIMAAGAGLGAVAAFSKPSPAPTARASGGGELPDGASAFDIVIDTGGDDETDTGASEDPAWMKEWSPAIFRLGFSFFVAFAVAYALRMFVKMSLVVVGLFALMLFGLEYAGLLEIHWGAIGDKYESLAGWASGQFESFKTFITGELPSAGAAVAGLALGFKRG